MDKNLYMTIPDNVYNQLVLIQEKNKENMKQLLKDLKVAEEFGDLSENQTYDNIKNRISILSKTIELNEDYLANCKVETMKNIRLTCGNLFKKFTVKISDIRRGTSIVKEYILIPPIECGILKGLPINSQLGKNIMESEQDTIEYNIRDNETIYLLTVIKKEDVAKKDIQFEEI